MITVGERVVTLGELEKDLKSIIQDIEMPPEAAVERILDHYLILEYGREKGIQVTETELDRFVGEIKRSYDEKDLRDVLLKQYVDFETWKEILRKQLLAKKILRMVSEEIPPVSHDEIKSYYEKHREEFKRPGMVKLRHILTNDREEAEGARQRLIAGEDMAALAREISMAPEAQDGGMIGWVYEGELEEAMGKAVSALEAGQISPVVKTSYGYHIFQVLERRKEGYMSLPEAIPEIESRLFIEKESEFVGAWLNGLRERYPVWVNRELLFEMLESE
ncbi:MAG: peptidyl-prolyl cis-trans isomerase [Deltaproteobacteria bacterium]|nr:peptidyl-prolyl cis-trans isomerase [Deltaproteobacteria bacterium]